MPRDVKVALVLGAASGISIALLFPYVVALMPQLARAPWPLPALIAAQVVQGGLFGFGLAWVGLRLGRDLGLDAPFLRAALEGAPAPQRSRWVRAIPIGLAVGAMLVCADRFVLLSHQPAAIRSVEIARWKGLLASFYGGIAEEVLTRLFLMTAIAWLVAKVLDRASAIPIAIVIASAAFAAGHLPAVAQVAPLDGWNVARVLALNGAGGLAFGWIFARWGIEHAMVAHFSADIVLHVLS